jgi:hypothetical protein
MLILFLHNFTWQADMFNHEGFHIFKIFKMGFFLGADMLNLTSELSSGFIMDSDYEGVILTGHYFSSGLISHQIIAQNSKLIVIRE